jgi:hypothetical protein
MEDLLDAIWLIVPRAMAREATQLLSTPKHPGEALC